MSTTLQPTDLRSAINAGLDLAEERDQFRQAALDYAADLAEARESLRRIDRILANMRDEYAAHNDMRGVSIVDTIRKSVVAPELPGGAA